MGRVVVEVEITNAIDPNFNIKCNALVDTGTTGMVLPKEWKGKLGDLQTSGVVNAKTADQRVVTAEVCGPVKIQLKGFKPIFNEVTFLEMDGGGDDEDYEPLVGYVILEQSGAAVDPVNQKLDAVRYYDLKRALGN